MSNAWHYEHMIKSKIHTGMLSMEKGKEFMQYLYSGGDRLPDHIMLMPSSGRARHDAATRFRRQFKKVAGVSSSSSR
jgi:hypothetical protein